MQRYDVGDKPRVFVNFTDVNGLPSEPSEVKCGFTSPSGVTTIVDPGDIEHDTSINPESGQPYVGRYYIDLLLTEGNDEVPWWVRFEGSGAVTAAKEQALPVRVPNVVIP